MTIREQLEYLQNESKKEFDSKLIPNIDKNKILGIKVPELRKLAKELFKNGQYKDFINDLPHKYQEENLLHGFIIQQIKDYELALKETERFLPYVDNWAVTDTFAPKIFKKNTDKLIENVKVWINSKEIYTIRFGIICLMDFYLNDFFKKEYLSLPLLIDYDDYYVNMAIAWFYATALAKQYNSTIKLIETNKLSRWIHNKTIQKSIESFRITKEQKDYLKTLRR